MDPTRKPFIFIDLDDTILDFSGNLLTSGLAAATPLAERHGLRGDELLAAFRTTADAFWRDPSRAVEGRRDLVVASSRIMSEAAQAFGVAIDATEAMAFSREYRALRDAGLQPFPEALQALERFE